MQLQSKNFVIPSWLRKIISACQSIILASYLLYFLIFAAIICGIATYYAITRTTLPFGLQPDIVMALVLADLILLLFIMIIISRKIIILWFSNKQGRATGSRLQSRIIMMFAIVAAAPTIIVSVFSALFFNYGIQSWFDEQVSTAIEESVAVAEAYLHEHEKLLLADADAMVSDLDKSSYLVYSDKKLFQKIVETQTVIRSLSDAIVFSYDKDKALDPFNYDIIAKGRMSFAISFDRPEEEYILLASEGQKVIINDTENTKIKILVRFSNMPNMYLMVGRLIDHKVIEHMRNAQGGAQKYAKMRSQISQLQITFSIIFIIVALLLLFSAILVGIIFTNYFIIPIEKLVRATEDVKDGVIETSIKIEGPDNDEFVILSKAFNQMTDKLTKQRNALVDANHQIDLKRRFSEAVLSGVSAGVIALDIEKKIISYNKMALNILQIEANLMNGYIEAIIPELKRFLDNISVDNISINQTRNNSQEVFIMRNGKKINLNIKLTTEFYNNNIEGYVLTFDDISLLVSAQRSAAWKDVARRIAHEIKNP
ncbi:MAG: HAMP domain-containing protein, partial [Pseudomonadota bacterium]